MHDNLQHPSTEKAGDIFILKTCNFFVMVIIDWYFGMKRCIKHSVCGYTTTGSIGKLWGIFIAILLSILVLEAYIRLWLRIRLFGVIYQICELFLILWTLLCKEWNCDFWLPKDILGDIPHALVIWREIINNFLLLMDFPSCRIVILF